MVPPEALAALRDQLHAMRLELVESMAADGVEPAFLHLMAGVQATLAAIDAGGEAATAIDRPAHRRRGGDPHANQRARRDAALRELAASMGDDVPAQRQAREIVRRLARYRPAAEETTEERLLMRQIIDTGLAVPKADRIKRILKTG